MESDPFKFFFIHVLQTYHASFRAWTDRDLCQKKFYIFAEFRFHYDPRADTGNRQDCHNSDKALENSLCTIFGLQN